MAKRNSKGSYPVWFTLNNGKRGRWTFHTLKQRDAGETNIKNLIDLSNGIETRETRDSLKWAMEQRTKDEKLYLKLIEWGLMEDTTDRERTLKDLFEHFQTRGVKSSTLGTYIDAFNNLFDFFGADKLLRNITPKNATEFEVFLRTAARRMNGKGGKQGAPIGSGLAKPTVKKRIERVRQFFLEAKRLKWISENPFEAVHGGNVTNPEKWLYISKEITLKVMANTPNKEIRAKIALCRFAGARGKSEFDSLEWNQDWIRWSADGTQGTVRLHRTKTEDSGFSDTIVPMVPELEAALRDLFDAAAPGSVKVFTVRSNPGKTIKDAFIRDGVDIITPYNMRRSYCRDLMEAGLDPKSYEYYAGHSLRVALKHYQQWDELRAAKTAPKVLEALTGSSCPDRRADRRADWRAVESNLESRNSLRNYEVSGNLEPQTLKNKDLSQKETPHSKIMLEGQNRGYTI